MLCRPSRGCHTFAVLERGVCLHSEPPNSLGSSGVPWGKERVPGTSLRIWGRRQRNLCEALDGAANTRSDTQVPRAVESLLLCFLLLPGVLGPDTGGSEADQCIWSYPGEKRGENPGEFVWMTSCVTPHTTWHVCQGVCPV